MKKIILFIFVPIALATGGEFFLKYNINLLSDTESLSFLEQSRYFLSHAPLFFSVLAIILGGVLWVVSLSEEGLFE